MNRAKRKCNSKQLLLLATAAILSGATSSPVLALTPCDFFRGMAYQVCVEATKMPPHNNRSIGPATAPPRNDQGGTTLPTTSASNPYGNQLPTSSGSTPPPPQTSSASEITQPAAQPYNSRQQGSSAPDITSEGNYTSSKFSGLTIWRQMFDKAAHSPKEFAEMQSKMYRDAHGIDAAANSVALGPKRNDLEKIATDYELYRLYYKNPEVLLNKQNECLVPRNYSSAEACDCLAGFPGDTSIGPGVGELVLGSNRAAATKACSEAAAGASNAQLKARYLAQQARAEVRTSDPTDAMSLADQAISSGYRRAVIVKAEGPLWDIEFMSGGFPPMTQATFNSEMKTGMDYLKEARGSKVPETYLVAKKYDEVLLHVKFDSKVLKPILKAMMTDTENSQNGCDNSCQNQRQVFEQQQRGY